jgi:Pvc16 N-terminal domain
MSNALAIASVSAVLKDLLNNAAIDHQLSNVVGEVKVSALPPDRVLVDGTPETSRINLFMYQVTPNPGWRNVDLPSRDASGERTASPPLALDLHYLVSAYGASEFHAEILLGYAAQLLHETPVLTRDAIRRTLAPASPVTSVLPPPLDTLTASELADQVEQIRVTPETMSLEEISRLWGAIQSHYRPTAAYQASVVLIESRRSVRSALPVADDKRRIYVIPFRQPVIEQAVNADGDLAPIAAGATLAIRGRDLAGEQTFVNLDGIEVTPASADVTPELIALPLTSPLPAGLLAGVKGIQVIHKIKMGDPEADHRGTESNVAAFVLRPTITNGPVVGGGDIVGMTSSTEVVDGVTLQLRAGNLRLAFDPNVGKEQRVSLFLNQLNAGPGIRPRAYTFRAPAGNGVPDGSDDVGSVEIRFERVVAGTYLVRAQVNGAESLLAPDGTGAFATPQVTLA